MIELNELVKFLDRFFAVHRFEDEPSGVYRYSNRPVRRLGLALEPLPQLAEWVSHERLDALFLHRPWKLEPAQLPTDIGIISYHLAFDEGLTLGFNSRLAIALDLDHLEVLGEKQGRALGMIGAIPAQPFEFYCRQVEGVFGGQEEVCIPTHTEMTRAAVVGAMTDKLVREAADRGAQIYITGQFRQNAELALAETRIGAIVVGHSRSELWGLRALAGILRERWAKLEVILPPPK